MSLGVLSGDLIGHRSLSFSDIAFVNGKPETARLGLAVQLGFRRMTPMDRVALTGWIFDELCADGQSIDAMLDHVFLWCRDRRIYGPSRKELERLVRSQRHLYLEALLIRASDRLARDTVALLEASLADPDGPTGFNTMKGDAGQATLDNILGVTAKLAFIQQLGLSRDFLSVVSKAWVDQIVRRVAGEKASEMRRHAPVHQLGLYVVYLMAREAQLTDAMVDLLIETVHKIASRSKRKVVRDITKDIERVYGKERLLVEIASASIDDPSGRICDVIFPIAGKDKLAAIIKESQAKGALDRRIYKVMRGSWAGHYRRILPSLLSALEFRSNNAVWRPVLPPGQSPAQDRLADAFLQNTPVENRADPRLNGAQAIVDQAEAASRTRGDGQRRIEAATDQARTAVAANIRAGKPVGEGISFSMSSGPAPLDRGRTR